MRLNVGQKIFSIAVVTLVLMLIVALYSLKLIDNIADDLASISGKQIPVAEGITRIDVHILQHSVLLERLLVSPEFLFRIERDPATVASNSVYRISDLELASRLSFLLWSSIPDDALLDAAVRGDLGDPVPGSAD